MSTSIKINGSCIGVWDNVLKKFYKILDLSTINIPFTKKTQIDISLTTASPEPIEMNSVSNAKALVFYSNYPVKVYLNGETTGHVCDPLYVATNKSGATSAYTAITVERINNVDTSVTIGVYE